MGLDDTVIGIVIVTHYSDRMDSTDGTESVTDSCTAVLKYNDVAVRHRSLYRIHAA